MYISIYIIYTCTPNLIALHSYSFTGWSLPVWSMNCLLLSHGICTESKRTHLEMFRQSAVKSKHMTVYFTKIAVCHCSGGGGNKKQTNKQNYWSFPTNSLRSTGLQCLLALSLLHIFLYLERFVFLCSDAFLLIFWHELIWCMNLLISVYDTFNPPFTTSS